MQSTTKAFHPRIKAGGKRVQRFPLKKRNDERITNIDNEIGVVENGECFQYGCL